MNHVMLRILASKEEDEIQDHEIVLQLVPHKFETLIFQEKEYTVINYIHFAESERSIDGEFTEPITVVEVIVRQ